VRRSGIRWLRDDGALCQPGEVIAYCNIGVIPTDDAPRPFAGETLDLQVAMATRLGGRLRRAQDASRGGFFDLLDHFLQWTPDYVIGTIEPPNGQPIADADGELRLMMTTGQRPSDIIDNRKGLASGSHHISRAWWSDAPGPMGVILAQGICDMLGVVKGDSMAFLELFGDAPGSAHVIYVDDGPVVPSARQLLEEIRRTPEERAVIAHDLMQSLATGAITPTPADWIFAGVVLNNLQRSPLTRRFDVLSRHGLAQSRTVDAVLLTVNSEPAYISRHKRLGYSLHCHNFRLAQAGPAFQRWYVDTFEIKSYPIESVAADYRALIGAIREHAPTAQILVLNAMSTMGAEDLHTYAAYDAPMGAALETVRNKDLNLMLADLATELDLVVIDADAIASELGGQRSIPDGLHQNGPMQSELRAEVLRVLRARGVTGLAAAN